LPFEVLVKGSFGKYNKMVSESLTDMGIKIYLLIWTHGTTEKVNLTIRVI
jgi:hypothetical protein